MKRILFLVYLAGMLVAACAAVLWAAYSAAGYAVGSRAALYSGLAGLAVAVAGGLAHLLWPGRSPLDEMASRTEREDAKRMERGLEVLSRVRQAAGRADAALIGQRVRVAIEYRACVPAGVGLYELSGQGPGGLSCVFRFALAGNERDLDAVAELEPGAGVTVDGRISAYSAARVTFDDPTLICLD